jgi:hypothetical protein
MRTVFISHSANGNPYTEVVLNELCTLLRERNYEPLVDRTALRPGEEWPTAIRHWVESCGAAVVLLSEEALKSEWVGREVEGLLDRRWREGAAKRRMVRIIPVSLRGVRPHQVKQTVRLKGLIGLHFLSVGSELSEAEAARRIAGKFTPLPPTTDGHDAMDAWRLRIAHKIEKIDLTDALVAAAKALGAAPDACTYMRHYGGSLYMAELLMSSGLSLATVKAIAELMPYMSADDRRDLVREISPVWVNGEAAGLIVGPQSTERLVALLNARFQRTGTEYFERATCRVKYGYQMQPVGILTGHESAVELVAAWEDVIENIFFIGQNSVPPKSYRYFLVVHAHKIRLEVAAEAIRDIHQRYPWLGVLLLTGDAMPDADTVQSWLFPNAVPLVPQLQVGAELGARQMVTNLENLLN